MFQGTYVLEHERLLDFYFNSLDSSDLLCCILFQGDTCEQCMTGFSKYPDSSPTSQCVPCDCSGQSCDILTGLCQCTNNTEGTKCERCLPGFYGDPSSSGGQLIVMYHKLNNYFKYRLAAFTVSLLYFDVQVYYVFYRSM